MAARESSSEASEAAVYLPPQGASTLTPLAQLCPGLHGEGDTVTRRVTWRALLCGDGAVRRRFEVPVFQRAYCWPAELAENWFDDAVAGAARGPRNVGVVLTRARGTTGTMLVIDGQQRLTTTLLAVAAVRDAAERLRAASAMVDGSGEAFALGTLVDGCLATLCCCAPPCCEYDATAAAPALAPAPVEGARYPAARLEPSFFDRRSFHALLGGTVAAAGQPGAGLGAIASASAHDDSASALAVAKHALDAKVERELKRWRSGGVGAQVNRLRALHDALLDGLQATHVDVVSRAADDCQLFLFVQEQGLLRQPGDEPHAGPSGGVRPGPADLVRNLLAAAFSGLGPETQDEVFRKLWLEPLERRACPRGLDAVIADFVAADDDNGGDGDGDGDAKFVCEFEHAVIARHDAVGGVDAALAVYARFVSRLASVETDLRRGTHGPVADSADVTGDGNGNGNGNGNGGRLVELTALGDGTLTLAPTAANFNINLARGGEGGGGDGGGDSVLRVAAERILRDLATFVDQRITQQSPPIPPRSRVEKKSTETPADEAVTVSADLVDDLDAFASGADY